MTRIRIFDSAPRILLSQLSAAIALSGLRVNCYPICNTDRKSRRCKRARLNRVASETEINTASKQASERASERAESGVERDREVMKGGTTRILAGLNEH